MADRTEHLVLEGERPKSWNEFWSGMHWSERKDYKDAVKMLVRSVIDPNVEPFDVPANILITAYFKGQMQDSPNICTKPYIDALIGWLIVDDSPKYLDTASSRSRKDNDNPRVEILITEA